MGLAELIFGIDGKKAFGQRQKAINEFRSEVIGLIGRLIPLQKNDAWRQRLEMMKGAVSRSVIKGYPSGALAAGRGFAVLGENRKLVLFNPKTKKYAFVGPDIISVPQFHIFRGNMLTERGRMTLLHEFSHSITPNEFAADLTAAKMAMNLGISKPAILRSLIGRGGIIGREKALGLMGRVIAARGRRIFGKKPAAMLRPRFA